MKILTGPLVLALQDATTDSPRFDSGASVLWMLLQTIFVLAFVCALAWVVLRFLPRRAGLMSGGNLVQIVDRVSIDQRRSLYVVRVVDRWLLIGSSEAGVQLITELDAEAASREAEAAERRGSVGERARTLFADRLAELMRKKK